MWLLFYLKTVARRFTSVGQAYNIDVQWTFLYDVTRAWLPNENNTLQV